MSKVINVFAKTLGILVYVGLAAALVVRLVTGEGDPLVPLIGFILVSGLSALMSLVNSMTTAVGELVKATNTEVELLFNWSQANSILGTVPQKDSLN